MAKIKPGWYLVVKTFQGGRGRDEYALRITKKTSGIFGDMSELLEYVGEHTPNGHGSEGHRTTASRQKKKPKAKTLVFQTRKVWLLTMKEKK